MNKKFTIMCKRVDRFEVKRKISLKKGEDVGC